MGLPWPGERRLQRYEPSKPPPRQPKPRPQKALMEARICLLGSTAVGTETLKNLVLPGCGQVTIVDDAIVAEGDLGNNFFVTAEDVGTPRAEAVCKWLVEMNDDVKGEARVANATELAETEPDFFTSFSLIIATQLPRAALRKVAAIAWAAGIPFMVRGPRPLATLCDPPCGTLPGCPRPPRAGCAVCRHAGLRAYRTAPPRRVREQARWAGAEDRPAPGSALS